MDRIALRRRLPSARAAAVAAALGLAAWAGALAPLEHAVGLPLLYALRGAEAPPPGAAVVAVDEGAVRRLNFDSERLAETLPRLAACLPAGAATKLGRARNVEDLPRAVYGCALRELARRGAERALLDVHFHEPGDPADDAALARALADTPGAAILETISAPPGADGLLVRERPAPAFEAAADGVGFFVVETTGGDVRRYVGGFAAYPDARPLSDLALEAPPPPGDWEGPRAFRDLWFYGPPGTLPEVSLIELFEPDPLPELAGAAVFVGSSEPGGDEVRDSFETPFSDAARGDTGGVEVVATAYLNALEGGGLRRLPAWGEGVLVGLAALAVLWIARAVGGLRGALAAAALSGAVLLGIVLAFGAWRLHLPGVAVWGVAGPLAVLLTLSESYSGARAVVERILPAPIARRRLQPGGEAREPARQELASALVADLVGSAELAERLGPEAFARRLEAFYEAVETAVTAHGGLVVKFLGDGALAVFPRSLSGPGHAACACRAARALLLDGLMPGEAEGAPLAARLGVATGEVVIGDIGAGRHNMIDALGDAINVADRLQRLAKQVFPGEVDVILIDESTRKLASSEDFDFEDCGLHSVPGRRQAIRVNRLRA